jgi:hypothetical protein
MAVENSGKFPRDLVSQPPSSPLARVLLLSTTFQGTEQMNIKEHHATYPDTSTVPSELSFTDAWDGEAVSDIIRAKCDHGETPAFLFLGRKEADLLKAHLAEAFGEDSVTTLHGTYYMGLDVIPIDCGSFLSTGGRKVVRTLQDPMARRPAWRDKEVDALWQFRI